MEIIFKEEVYAIVGAAIEVHKTLGAGFLEPVYQEALEIEATLRQLSFLAQPKVQIRYKNHVLQKYYIPDFIFFNQILVEIKALDQLTSREEAQVLNSLKASGHKVGVLINFGTRGKLEWKRFVF